MCELKKYGKVFTNKFFGTGPSSFEKRIYRVAVSQRLRNTDIQNMFRILLINRAVQYMFTVSLINRTEEFMFSGLLINSTIQ